MNLSKESYDTMTAEQLEEYIEFIDWKEFPIGLINDELKTKFSNFPKLKARIWFEEILNSLERKTDSERFGNKIFFFKEDEILFEYSIKERTIYCSREKIWMFLSKECLFNYSDIVSFIIFMLDNKFQDLESIPTWIKWNLEYKSKIEEHFKKAR